MAEENKTVQYVEKNLCDWEDCKSKNRPITVYNSILYDINDEKSYIG